MTANVVGVPWNPRDPFAHPNNFRMFTLLALAVSPINGDLHLTWVDYRHDDADIYFTRSSDGGDHWATPIRLNDDEIGNGIDQFQPQIAMAPNGRLAVMWFALPQPAMDSAGVPGNRQWVY